MGVIKGKTKALKISESRDLLLKLSLRKVFPNITRMNAAPTAEFGNVLCGMSLPPTSKPGLFSPFVGAHPRAQLPSQRVESQGWDKDPLLRSKGGIEEAPGQRCCRRSDGEDGAREMGKALETGTSAEGSWRLSQICVKHFCCFIWDGILSCCIPGERGELKLACSEAARANIWFPTFPVFSPRALPGSQQFVTPL